MNRAFFVVVAVVCFASVAPAQPTAARLSLDEAVALAIQHNRQLESAGMQVARAENDVETAHSRLFPSFSIDAQAAQLLAPVDVNFKAGTFGTLPGGGPIPATDSVITTEPQLTMFVNAQVWQPLSQIGRIKLNVRMSEASRDIQREQVRAARLELVTSVKKLYFAILQTESSLAAAEHSISLLKEVSRTVDERLLRQVVLRTEALDVGARIAQAEHSRLTLRHALATQKEQMNQLIGRDVRTAFETLGPPAPSIAESHPEAALAQALDARPDIVSARLRLQQAELAHKSAKAESIPDVSVGVSYLSPFNIDGAPRQIATAGVQLQWEPFDWGRRGRTVASRDLEIRQARNSVRDAEDKAILEINTAFRRVEEARSRLQVARLSQDSARETMRVRSTQYQAQSVLLADVLRADASQADADNEYEQALLALWQAGADYEHALGQEVTQ
jgi:outer membrane protein TolC